MQQRMQHSRWTFGMLRMEVRAFRRTSRLCCCCLNLLRAGFTDCLSLRGHCVSKEQLSGQKATASASATPSVCTWDNRGVWRGRSTKEDRVQRRNLHMIQQKEKQEVKREAKRSFIFHSYHLFILRKAPLVALRTGARVFWVISVHGGESASGLCTGLLCSVGRRLIGGMGGGGMHATGTAEKLIPKRQLHRKTFRTSAAVYPLTSRALHSRLSILL